MREVNRRTDRRILKIFLPGFRNQREILTDFLTCNCSGLRIHLLFGPGFLILHVIKTFLPGFRIQGEMLTRIWLIKHKRIGGFAYPYSPSLILTHLLLSKN